MSETATEEKLIGRRDGHVGHVIFNNPAKLNAVSLDMWEKAFTVLDGFASDPEIRVVVVSGTGGRAFVSGADISKFESERASEEAAAKYNATSLKAYEALYNFAKPTIAKVTGYCIGGGMNLAACCDLRFCNEAAKFGIPAGKARPRLRLCADQARGRDHRPVAHHGNDLHGAAVHGAGGL